MRYSLKQLYDSLKPSPCRRPRSVIALRPEAASNRDDDLESQLCRTCRYVVRYHGSAVSYWNVLSSSDSIKASVAQGCYLCALFWAMGLSEISWENQDIILNEKQLPSHLYGYVSLILRSGIHKNGLEMKWISLILRPGCGLNEEYNFPKRPKSLYSRSCDSTASDPIKVLARRWLQNCENHKECKPTSAFIPTRLIYIGMDNPPRIYLYHSTDSDLGRNYTTLSHCWGRASPMRLLQDNLQFMEQEISFNELPRTFQHAVIVTQRLEVQYLWIDSLCITQDSISDWHRESALMSQVYSNSYCNISATAAYDGSGGLFFDQDSLLASDWYKEPTNASTVYSSNYRDTSASAVRGGSGSLLLNNPSVLRIGSTLDNPLVVYSSYNRNNWDQEINHSPLNRRGWVLQERLLSRRNLHFGSSEMFWECCNETSCETFPDGLPSDMPSTGLKMDFSGIRMSILPKEVDAVYYQWQDIVRTYTSANLTYETDRLVAISGLASIFHDVLLRFPKGQFSDDYPTYKAGLWAPGLSSQLLWQVIDVLSLKQVSSIYVAPSWSWAAVGAKIEKVFSPPSSTSMDLITILSSSTTLVNDSNPFGQVRAGKLIVNGKLAMVSYNGTGVSFVKGVERPEIGILKVLAGSSASATQPSISGESIYWDFAPLRDFLVTGEILYLLPIRLKDPNVLRQLLLELDKTLLGGADANPEYRFKPSPFSKTNDLLELEPNFLEGLVLKPTDTSQAKFVLTAQDVVTVPSEFCRVGKWSIDDPQDARDLIRGIQFLNQEKNPLDSDERKQSRATADQFSKFEENNFTISII